jgi:hypothetical protein
MADNDIFAEEEAVQADLALLESLRWSRMVFVERICAESANQDESVLSMLRLEPTYQLAEFYYLLGARRLATEEHIQMLADAHNQYIVELTKDQDKMDRLGLSPERALDAMFTGDTLPRLLHNWRERPGSIDQSNLARFLVAVMSTETCRKVLVACERGGFLERERTPYGTMLVTSRGVLERIFGSCLRDLRARIARGN